MSQPTKAFARLAALAVITGLLSSHVLSAAIVGTNIPAQEINSTTIATLPKPQQPAWLKYLDRSNRQKQTDQAVLRGELKRFGMSAPTLPPPDRSARSIPLDRDAAWYGASNAQFLADNIVSFQTPAGGWSKNLSFARGPRVPGEHFAPNNLSRFSNPDDFDLPHDADWDYVGTFDNDATTTEMRFLAKTAMQGSAKQAKKWRASFLRGVDYIFAAQFPNGGWPQVWPLQGGYHDCVTYNDGAVLYVMELLRDISAGKNEFAFVSSHVRRKAAASLERGIQCGLDAQIRVNGRLTVWCQQHNALTLAPAAGRNYEMPSQVSSESAQVMRFLMSLPNPSPAVIASVDGAAAWFKETAIYGKRIRFSQIEGRVLVAAPGAGPLWSRYVRIGDDHPIFGDRDKSIHDDMSEISLERRRGYNWYNGAPQSAMEQYPIWRKSVGGTPEK
jgi:PelA/Pel-15E family pectate lyase